MNLKNFIDKKNKKKQIFTPGPASLSYENIKSLEPCFGRGDKDYLKTENFVLEKLKKISGHDNIVRLQGSASLALEISTLNFLQGNILIINTGYYSDRLYFLVKVAKKFHKKIKSVNYVAWNKISSLNKKYHWIVSCYTETSTGMKLPIEDLYKLKKRCNSKLLLDATASIGLETKHYIADVIAYSSCKGLFGLTGASFIAYNNGPKNEIDSFYLNIKNHKNKSMTGPYHTIQSMFLILKNYNEYKYSVKVNKEKFLKRFGYLSPFEKKFQPLLCTYVQKKIKTKLKNAILYLPRLKLPGSVLCHLGEVHLGKKSKGQILSKLKII